MIETIVIFENNFFLNKNLVKTNTVFIPLNFSVVQDLNSE